MFEPIKRVLRPLKQALFSTRHPHTRGWRPQWLPRDLPLIPENVAHPHSPEEQAEKFLAVDAGSTEVETLNWLYATICLTKPNAVLETGAFNGLGTIALAAACQANGFGKVHSIEIAPAMCDRLRAKLGRYELGAWAEVHCNDSLKFLETTELFFDFAFFDSLCQIRADEYEIVARRGLLSGMATFHDTSPYRTRTLSNDPTEAEHNEYRRRLLTLGSVQPNRSYFEFKLSRGLFVIFPPHAPAATP